MHRIVFGLHDESRWSLCRRVNLGIRSEVLLCQGEVAWINEHRKIRTAAELVGTIDDFVLAVVVMRAQRCCKMRSRGESKHANAVVIQMPVNRMRTHNANG